MAEDSNVYPDTLQCRPAELDGSGSGVYCCIPLCKNATYNREKKKSGIGFFRFPKDKEMKVKWINMIKQFRRSGDADTFKVEMLVVCEFHFKTSEIKVSSGYGKKFLYLVLFQLFSSSSQRLAKHAKLHLTAVPVGQFRMSHRKT